MFVFLRANINLRTCIRKKWKNITTSILDHTTYITYSNFYHSNSNNLALIFQKFNDNQTTSRSMHQELNLCILLLFTALHVISSSGFPKDLKSFGVFWWNVAIQWTDLTVIRVLRVQSFNQKEFLPFQNACKWSNFSHKI